LGGLTLTKKKAVEIRKNDNLRGGSFLREREGEAQGKKGNFRKTKSWPPRSGLNHLKRETGREPGTEKLRDQLLRGQAARMREGIIRKKGIGKFQKRGKGRGE